MTRLGRWRLAAFVLGLGAVGMNTADADFIVDQSNNAAATIGLGNGNGSGFAPLGQSFTAGLNGIDFATFNFANQTSSSATYNVLIYQGFGVSGPLLGTSQTASVPAGFGGGFGGAPVEFDFASRVALTVGATYTLIANPVNAGSSGSLIFLYYSGNSYAGGAAVVNGTSSSNFVSTGRPSSDFDAIFSEGLITTRAVPEPASLALAGIGLAGAVGLGLRRRAKATA